MGKKADKKYELSEAVNAADLLKTEEMLKLVTEFNDDYSENHEPGFDEVKLYQALLEDEIVQLTEELELREKELNLETAVMTYRYKDPDEIPATKTVLTLNQLLNYPNRQERPAKLCIITRGLPGSRIGKVSEFIKKQEKLIGQDRAAIIRNLDINFKPIPSEASSNKDNKRILKKFLRNEHQYLVDKVKDEMKSSSKEFNVIYLVTGIFHEVEQFQPIIRTAKRENFTVLFAETQPPKLKNKEKHTKELESWFNSCKRRCKEKWVPHLEWLQENFEPLPESSLSIDAWELFEHDY